MTSVSSPTRNLFLCFAPVLLSLLLTLAQLLPAAGAVTLASNGKSGYQIVLPANSIPSEKYAAEELQKYLEKITGARLPVVSDSAPATAREIVLGADNERLKKLGINISKYAVKTDGFLLRTKGRRVVIAGGKPRGTLNGVYTFLEDNLGIRWFTPELEATPNIPNLKLPPLNQIHFPQLENREVFWTEMMRNGDFAARHRLNGNSYKLAEKHGGRFAVYFPFVHSFDDLIPRALYDQHPEYFPLINGKRTGGYVQRCLSNPDVLRLAKAKVREWIRAHPEASIISISQNDTINNCLCDQCKSLDDKEGTPAASLLQFVNAIAQDIESDFPNVRIDTLAYQYTRKPPKTIRPRRNVIVRLCSIECCFAHPLATCASDANKRFRDDIIAWQPVAPLLYVWDYTPNFANYQQPFPNFASLQPNVQFFVKHGVQGLFEQGNYSSGGYGELGPLRAYVLAKLLWNPQTDPQRHIHEFCDAYYGNASAGIQSFLKLMDRQVNDGKTHAHIFDSPRSSYLNSAFLAEADELLAATELAAADDNTRFHVQLVRLPVWYVQLATDRVKGDERAELLKRFLAIARKAGISNISEGQALSDWAKKMGAD